MKFPLPCSITLVEKNMQMTCTPSSSPEVFYKMIGDGAQPVTSQVNAEAYCALFEPVLKSGKDVLHLTLSSGISGSINSANVAKTQMEEKYPDRRVMVVDSLAASSGYGMLVEQTLENQRAGMSLEENAAWIVAHRNTLHHWFFSTDLTSYIRGGRVSKTAGFFGKMLNICPLLNVNSEGRLIPRSKYRGKKQVTVRSLSGWKSMRRTDGNIPESDISVSQPAWKMQKRLHNWLRKRFLNWTEKYRSTISEL